MRISLVGTIHEESGLANIVELLGILERLQPDVIFAEIPSAYIDEYLNGARGDLESPAVGRYRESHRCVVVPVDLDRPEETFFSDAKHLFDTIERTSGDYRRMMDRYSLDTRAEGFPYLNSGRCIQAWVDIYGEVQATIDWIREPRLQVIYDLWNHTNELRDRAMLKRIEDYCVSGVLANGVFLVGAAHRKSIIDKARAGPGSPGIEWDHSGLPGLPV